jgi:mono/diheme cytochrome c family protein
VRLAAAALAVVGAALVIVALATAGGGGKEQPAGRVQSAGTTGEAAPGLAVWAEQGCGSCHAFKPANATGMLAPNLTSSLEGRSKEFIRTSIVAPSAEIAPNYGDMMPEDFAQRIAPEDLDALVAFLYEGARR